MSEATAAMARISVELQNITNGYRKTAVDAGTKRAKYKNARGRVKWRAMVDSNASAAKGEAMADADNDVAQAYLDSEVSAAEADAQKQQLMTLRELYGGQRDLLRRETTADRAHGQVGV